MKMSDDALIRLKNLQALGHNPADLSRLIGKSYQYWRDLLAGNKSFGEKAARNIEEKLGLLRGCLDASEGCIERGMPPKTEALPDVAAITRIGSTTPRQALDILGLLIAEADDLTRDQIKPLFSRMCDEPGRIPEILKRIESALDAGNNNPAATDQAKPQNNTVPGVAGEVIAKKLTTESKDFQSGRHKV
jgi:hypothetical protein